MRRQFKLKKNAAHDLLGPSEFPGSLSPLGVQQQPLALKMTRISLTLAIALASSAAVPLFTNPVVPDPADTPDPGVAFDPASGRFFAATTTGNAPEGCFELRSSSIASPLAEWALHGVIFPPSALPAWIDPANPSCWAPELHNVSGGWRLVFVGRQRNGLLSVGVASADSPLGPFTDSGAPLVQGGGAQPQGQIDPTIAADASGALFLVWKTDGNADGRPTPIRAARLAPNASALAPGAGDWTQTQLITNDLPWEGRIVEAPWVVRRGGAFFLFYSGNGYGAGSYAVGVARSASLLGPYEKRGAPILKTAPSNAFPGPGHCSVVAVGNFTAIVYHAHSDASSKRHLMLDVLAWRGDGKGGEWPEMASGLPQPGEGPQPLPWAGAAARVASLL